MPVILPKRPTTLEFDGVQLTLEDMRLIGQQTTLKGLVFSNCPLTDQLLEPLSGLKNLVNLTVSGANITDGAFAHLAGLAKLHYLFIDDNPGVTGSGFVYLESVPLDTIWACRTSLDDIGLLLAAKMPKLSILRIDGTKATFSGLMKVAHNRKLEVLAPDLFTEEQIAAFKAEQRSFGKKKKTVDAAAAEVAQKVLQNFFAAMIEWETLAAKTGLSGSGLSEKCQAIFDKYVIAKPRKGFRPGWLSVSTPPEYQSHKIVDLEQVTKNKLYFYTENKLDFQYRFLLVCRDGNWKIDDAQWMSGGWQHCGL